MRHRIPAFLEEAPRSFVNPTTLRVDDRMHSVFVDAAAAPGRRDVMPHARDIEPLSPAPGISLDAMVLEFGIVDVRPEVIKTRSMSAIRINMPSRPTVSLRIGGVQLPRQSSVDGIRGLRIRASMPLPRDISSTRLAGSPPVMRPRAFVPDTIAAA